MRNILAGVAVTLILGGCAEDREHHHGRDHDGERIGWSSYDYDHPDPAYGGYEADRYYREDSDPAHDRRIAREERIYRGHDGRYYCRRSDGSTGLIVGAIAGGALGDVIAPGGSALLGTALGAVAGGLAGQAIDENDVHCR